MDANNRKFSLSFILSIDETLIDTTTRDQDKSGSDGKKNGKTHFAEFYDLILTIWWAFCYIHDRVVSGEWQLYTLPMNTNGYVPFLILLYTLPMNINGYVPFLILLYTLPMNINGYVPFLILLYTLPMNINGYVPFSLNAEDQRHLELWSYTWTHLKLPCAIFTC